MLKPESLAYAMLGAAEAVAQVRNGRALPAALSETFDRRAAPAQARGAIQDIAYRSLRRLGTAEALILRLTAKAPAPPLHALLCCALALLSYTDADEPPYEAFTVVDQAVGAAASEPELARAKNMVNAVLRRFLRERETLQQQLAADPVAIRNYPAWWIDAMKSAYPAAWQHILEAGNRAPPLTLRINRRRTAVSEYLLRLAQHGIAGRQIGPFAVRLDQPLPAPQIPGFADGSATIQDAAAQLAAPLLDLRDGMRVLDACAAPGGKSSHILETAAVDLSALDHDPKRLARVEENLARLGLRATLIAGDAAGRGWWDGRPFSRILADVPCTASGIVRRHPDIRWLRRKSDTAQLATLSAKILDNLWQMLGPDGKLLFVTCSLWPQESEAQAAAFATRNQAIRLAAPGQLLPVANAQSDQDGLFFALFQKPAV